MEIITGSERRRRWRLEEKLRIVAEVERPGASFADVARRHEVSRGLLLELARPGAAWRVGAGADADVPVDADHGGSCGFDAGADTGCSCCRGSPGRDYLAGRDLHPGGGGYWVGDVAASHDCGAPVIVPPSGVRVWLANGHTDMRRGMNGLALQVQEALQRDPHAGDLYVFRGRRGDLVKIFWHDGLGMSLYAKRLERGRFLWPSPVDGCVAISASQLGYMLDGIDWRNPQRTWRPEMAG